MKVGKLKWILARSRRGVSRPPRGKKSERFARLAREAAAEQKRKRSEKADRLLLFVPAVLVDNGGGDDDDDYCTSKNNTVPARTSVVRIVAAAAGHPGRVHWCGTFSRRMVRSIRGCAAQHPA